MNTLQKVIAGLQIIAKYDSVGYDIAADHDIIYAGAESVGKMSEDDKRAMQENGWDWSEQYDSFYLFV